MTPTPPRWFKSSYSGNDDADCVEAAISPTPRATIHIRDSKRKDGARLGFTDRAWSEFLRSIRP
ncbi:DUF397 domain-containing protein [Streptomyces paradoxus]|uniref:DUF397 domain-containing protein n=1 Tax=Streptomyces paradoxus TaxID=66375 RepID=UPI0037FBC41D